MKKKILLAFCVLWVMAIPAQSFELKNLSKGYDFYAFGVNLKTFDTDHMNYPAAIAGALTAVALHAGGHYAYAGLNHMSITQDGLREMVAAGYSERQYREFASAGMITQAIGGLILTSLPWTRQTSFTKGYVIAELLENSLYSQFFKNDGDFIMSRKYGGSGWEEYGYDAIALHNIFRINWKAEVICK
jgi:hypothetical protein